MSPSLVMGIVNDSIITVVSTSYTMLLWKQHHQLIDMATDFGTKTADTKRQCFNIIILVIDNET